MANSLSECERKKGRSIGGWPEKANILFGAPPSAANARARGIKTAMVARCDAAQGAFNSAIRSYGRTDKSQ